MSKGRILIVEDETVVAEALKASLENTGYEVVAVAHSGEEAADLAVECQPELALIDIELGGRVDGIEAARRIRASLNLPIIYLTAHDDEATLKRAAATAPLGYLLKPFREKEMLVSIETALGAHRALVEEEKEKLALGEEKFQGLLEAAPDAILATDREGLILMCNGRTENMFGYSRDELIGKPIEVLLPERFRKEHREHREKYYLDAQTRPMGSELELFGRRKDGSEFPVDISLSAIKSDEGLLVTRRCGRTR